MTKFLKGLANAAINGFATGALTLAVAPEFLTQPDGYRKVAFLAVGGAVIGVLNYLKQTPLE